MEKKLRVVVVVVMHFLKEIQTPPLYFFLIFLCAG